MIIIGMDIASKTGVTVAKYDKETEDLEIIHKEVIKLKPKQEYRKQFKSYADKLIKIIEEHKPEELCIERAYSSGRHTSDLKLFMLQGITQYLMHDLEAHTYAPKTIKKEVAFHGNATKDKLKDILEEHFEVEFEDDNESDSCGVIVTHLIKKYNFTWER